MFNHLMHTENQLNRPQGTSEWQYNKNLNAGPSTFNYKYNKILIKCNNIP